MSSSNSSPTPIALDGGWGWVVVVGSFLAYFIADGWSYSFGIIYPNLLEHFHEGKGTTAIIGALMYGVPLLISPIVCALTTVYGCRKVAVIGGFITGISFIMSAFAKSLLFLCFTLGILASIGLSMTYIPSIVIVTVYFEKHRGLATGLAVTGSGLGAFAFPPLVNWLLTTYNWRGALLVLGGISFNIIIAGLLFRPPPMTTDHLETQESSLTEQKNTKHFKKAGNILLPRLHNISASELTNRSQSTNDLDKKSKEDKLTLSIANIYVSKQTDSENNEKSHLLDKEGAIPLSSPITVSSPELYFPSSLITPASSADAKHSAIQQTWQEIKLVMKSMMDSTLLSNCPFLIYCAHNFILYLWVGAPYVYLVDKATLIGIDEVDAAFLLSIIGISRTAGQLVLGFLGDNPKISIVGLYTASIAIAGLLTLLVPVYNSYGTLCLYSSLFGFFVSVLYALQMMCVVDIIGIQKATNGFGIIQLFQGIATLLGTPIAGN